MPFDQPHAYRGAEEVRVTKPGLYVFLCKLHPFMLGAVIVDDPATQGLDLGDTITLRQRRHCPDGIGSRVPSACGASSTSRAPQNYQVHTATGSMWDPEYPAVPVLAHDKNGSPVLIPDLNAAFQSYFHEPIAQPAATPPAGKGIGEVWINTEYEQTAAKTKPGTATAVDASDWTVTRKVALPSVNMNNPHNMWTDRSQSLIYADGVVRRQARPSSTARRATCSASITVGQAPAHVMTRVDTDQVHVSHQRRRLGRRAEPRSRRTIDRTIQVQDSGNPGQPHAHWMSLGRPHDGDAELEHERLHGRPRPAGHDRAEGRHRHAADREQHDAGRRASTTSRTSSRARSA